MKCCKTLISIPQLCRNSQRNNSLPFLPVWIQSYTSSSSVLSTPRRISPVRSLYKSSLSWATCAACAASALPTMIVRACDLPLTVLPGVLPACTLSTTDEARTLASLACRALFSFCASVREVFRRASFELAVTRSLSLVAICFERSFDSWAKAFCTARSFRKEAIRSLAAVGINQQILFRQGR